MERQPIGLPRVKERTLLGLLVLHSNEVLSLDHLTMGLWEDSDLRPPATLRVHISRLRRSLAALGTAAPPLVASQQGYVLRIRPEAVDARRFERLAAEGRRQLRSGKATAASSTLNRALGSMAGSRAQGPRTVRRCRAGDRPPGRGSPGCSGRPDRSRFDVRGRPGARRGIGSTCERASFARAPLGGADRCALPQRAPGRGAPHATRTYASCSPSSSASSRARSYRGWNEPFSNRIRTLEIGTARRFTTRQWHHPGRTLVREPSMTRFRHRARLTTEDALRFCGRQSRDRLTAGGGQRDFANEELKALVDRRARPASGRPAWPPSWPPAPTTWAPSCCSAVATRTWACRSSPSSRPSSKCCIPPRRPPSLGRHAGELVRLAPDLAWIVPGLEPPLQADPDTERYRLFDAVGDWLTAMSAEAGMVLVLDDIHWAEKPTLLLLRHLVRSAEPMRILVVGTYRDTDLDPDASAFPRDAGRSPFREPPVRRALGPHRFGCRGACATCSHQRLGARASVTRPVPRPELGQLLWSETDRQPLLRAGDPPQPRRVRSPDRG